MGLRLKAHGFDPHCPSILWSMCDQGRVSVFLSVHLSVFNVACTIFSQPFWCNDSGFDSLSRRAKLKSTQTVRV